MPIHDYIMSTYWLFLYCTLLMNYACITHQHQIGRIII